MERRAIRQERRVMVKRAKLEHAEMMQEYPKRGAEQTMADYQQVMQEIRQTPGFFQRLRLKAQARFLRRRMKQVMKAEAKRAVKTARKQKAFNKSERKYNKTMRALYPEWRDDPEHPERREPEEREPGEREPGE